MGATLEEGSPAYARHLLRHFPLNGGRGLRPALVLAAGSLKQKGKTKKPIKNKRLLKAAAAIELVHCGSLLHDDVVDEAQLRRHSPTINRLFGTREAVLLGDYFLSRAFTLVLELKIPRATSAFVRLMEAMVKGELLELDKSAKIETTEEDAFHIIELKTGSLFAEACYIGGLVAGLPEARLKELHTFGMEAGRAYQLTDDLLDATSLSSQLGKDTGNDLLQGKPTLPLVHALQLAPDNVCEEFTRGSSSAFPHIAELLCDKRVRTACMDKAREATQRALSATENLQDNSARKCLRQFAVFASERAAR